jgi:hypothetical protein
MNIASSHMKSGVPSRTTQSRSQLRSLAIEQEAHPDCASAILRARRIIGAIMLGMIVPLAMVFKGSDAFLDS